MIADATTELIGKVSDHVSSVVEHVWTLRRVELAPVAADGKRLRTRVALAAAEAGGSVDGERLASGAAAVELLHLGTLVHDDLMDASEQRRGLPATWVVHGSGRAIVAADALYAAAFESAARAGSDSVRVLAQSFIEACDGQAAELDDLWDPHRDVDRIEGIAARKTGALFGAAAAIGAQCGANPHVEAARSAGVRFGIAYQLLDDLRDVDVTRGGTGADLAAGLLTSPWVFALDVEADRFGVRDQLASRTPLEPDGHMIGWLWETGGPRAACDRIVEILARHRSESSGMLDELAERVVNEARRAQTRNGGPSTLC